MAKTVKDLEHARPESSGTLETGLKRLVGVVQELALTELDPRVVAEDAVESFRRTAELAGRTIVLEAVPAPRVRSDESILRRILQNLLRNAIRHTPPGSRVVVRVGVERTGRAAIDVVDDGPGIPEEMQAQIFEPFGAAALRGKGMKVDTGLGLPTCRVLAQSLGASLQLTSDGRRGTAFTVILP